MNIAFSIWLASKSRWAHLEKTFAMPAVPRVGEFIAFTNSKLGDYFTWQVRQVTYRESGAIEVWTELLNDTEGRGYSFDTEPELDEYVASYLAEGWLCPRGFKPNTRYRPVPAKRERAASRPQASKPGHARTSRRPIKKRA